MKVYKKWFFLVMFSVLLLGTGCAGAASENQGAPSPESETLVLTDMFDRKVELDQPVEKMVVLQPSDVEVVYALGAEDTLVAVGQYCNYPEDALTKTQLSSGPETNIEAIVSLAPDLIVMGVIDLSPEKLEQLESIGIPVLVMDANSIEETYQAIALLGQALNRQEKATALVEEMKEGFEDLRQRAIDNQGKSVYFEVSPLQYGLWTGGKGTFMEEVSQVLSLDNAFGDVEGWAQISEEQVLERNPYVIVTTTMYFGEGPLPSEEVLSRPAWQNIDAIKNKRVFDGDSDMLTRPGPRLLEGAQQLQTFMEQFS